MDSRAIRDAFTGFFADKGHAHVDSGPLVLRADPTLMFANAGMVQFKDVFTGKDRRWPAALEFRARGLSKT